MQITIKLNESEVLDIVKKHVESLYPEQEAKAPTVNVFATGDRMDNPTGHSFHVSIELSEPR